MKLLQIQFAITIFAAIVSGRLCYAVEPQPMVAGETHYETNVRPFLEKYCVDCHSGDGAEAGLDFDRYARSSLIQENFELWEKIRRIVYERQMPPADAEQPEAATVITVVEAIDVELASFDCSGARHPGRVTLRRLNKSEYNNTIRDLLGLELNLADDFPADDVGNGFDNIGDVLTLPPVLMEKYIAAAETIAKKVMSDENVRRRVLIHEAETDDQRIDVARRNVREFAARAFRRPLQDAEAERLFEIMRIAWEQDSPVEEIFEITITAILSSPNFLFKVEQDPAPDDEDGIRELDNYELATRLSYFLWSSMPDKELFDLAQAGKLVQHDVLQQQAIRMLKDPKSRSIVDNFAGQWLQLRDVSRLNPDPEKYPAFDAELRQAMRRETEVFFEKTLQENRNILEFLNADHTYVNERLARHYGIPDIQGGEFQQVSLPAGRRGVLTHASILMLTSNPTRTSPVKRGKWILENILAEPPPPPPANVPPLEEGAETLGSLREQMEQHRSNPLCSACHLKMDAIGFGMENFDAIGAWRDRDGRYEINAAGELPGGRNFNGASDLMGILVEEKKVEFCRALAQKLLTYALGRGLESYDRCAVNKIVSALEENDYRSHTLITEIVTSEPFMMREVRKSE